MKNKTKKRVGIIAVMLMVVVAIAATAGTTLAKYITSATVNSQSATVAQWGYTITTNGSTLFSEQYNANTIVTATNGTVDVKADAKVVAPGTSSNGATATDNALKVTINGYAEVDAQLVIDITDFNTVWLAAMENVTTATYYPLKWTITAGGDTNTAVIDLTGADTSKLNEKLAGEIAKNLGYEGVLPTGVTINSTKTTGSKVVIDLPAKTTIDNYALTIAWKWPFDNTVDANSNDAADTVLGWLAYNAKQTDDAKKIDGGITVKDNAEVTVSGLKTLAASKYNLEAKIGCKIQVVQTTNAA